MASGAALGFQQLLQSALSHARKRQETSLRFVVATFGVFLLTTMQVSTSDKFGNSAQLMCIAAIALSLLTRWLADRVNGLCLGLGLEQVDGELLILLLTGVLLTPAMLLTVFSLTPAQHWLIVPLLALAVLAMASISDAHPMRMIFLIGPMIIALITGLSWSGDLPDLVLALVITGVVFAAVVWLRQRHRSLMTSLVTRVNEQMIPIRLERQIAAQQMQLDEISLSGRIDWQDLEQPARGIVSLAHQLESAGAGHAAIARSLTRTSKRLAEQIHHHGYRPDVATSAGPQTAWTSVASLFEALRFRLIAPARAAGARLQFNAVSADIETTPIALERTVQNLVLHCLNDANASSVTVSARFTGQLLTIGIDHNGLRPLPALLAPNLVREGLPRALALAAAAPLTLRTEQTDTAGFSLSFEQWRKHRPRTIQKPRTDLTVLSERDASAKCRTLLIDDDPLARVGLAALLEKAGYDTIIWNGRSTDSIEYDLADAEISFIVSDWWLSKNANAIAMLKWVQDSLPAPVPVVIVSGDKGCLDGPLISAQLNGVAVRTLAKPVTPKTLARAISDLIELDQDFFDVSGG